MDSGSTAVLTGRRSHCLDVVECIKRWKTASGFMVTQWMGLYPLLGKEIDTGKIYLILTPCNIKTLDDGTDDTACPDLLSIRTLLQLNFSSPDFESLSIQYKDPESGQQHTFSLVDTGNDYVWNDAFGLSDSGSDIRAMRVTTTSSTFVDRDISTFHCSEVVLEKLLTRSVANLSIVTRLQTALCLWVIRRSFLRAQRAE